MTRGNIIVLYSPNWGVLRRAKPAGAEQICCWYAQSLPLVYWGPRRALIGGGMFGLLLLLLLALPWAVPVDYCFLVAW